jgi:SAM-dependent methyltransferase
MPDETRRVVSAAGHPVGIDLDLASLRDHGAYRDKLMAPAETLPFADGSFDLVSANMVVEHVADPRRMLAEIHRVLRPGGAFAFHTSSRLHWPLWLAARVPDRLKLALTEYLEDRRAADVFPTHYRLNDDRAVRTLAAAAGFRLERLDYVSTSAVSVMLGPLVLVELFWIRLLRLRALARLRSNLLVVLRKTH